MDNASNTNPRAESDSHSLTTRRGFIATGSFAVVSLYALWAALGAAPSLFGGDHADTEAAQGAGRQPAPQSAGHGGHGDATAGPTPEEFRRQADEFIARHRLPDGSVSLRTAAGQPRVTTPAHGGAHGADHGSVAAGGHGGIVAAPTGPSVDIYLLVQQWLFEPGVLRLDAGVRYRLRMMATDVSHGVAIQLGLGSRIIRLRRGVLTERDIVFTQPGQHLVYCTVYCGLGHDTMSSKIIVT